MSGSAKTIRLAARADNETLKPIPPADLWERLDAEVALLATKPPPESFTQKQFMERHPDLSDRRAYDLLAKLQSKGVIKEAGRWGSPLTRYFVMVENANSDQR